MPGSKEPQASSASPGPPSEVEELHAFLASHLIGAFASLLRAQEVDSLDAFADVIRLADLKDSLRQAFIDQKVPPPPAQAARDAADGSGMPQRDKAEEGADATTRRVSETALAAGHRAALAAFDRLSGENIDQGIETFREARKPPPAPSTPPTEARYQATAELKSYLKKEGFPEESMPVFEEHGAYSVQALEDLCGETARRDKLEHALRQGGVIDGRRFRGSDSAANLLKKLSADEVAARSKPPIQASELMSEQAQARRKQIEEAIAKVEELREACVGDASANLGTMKKRAETELAAVLERAGVGGALARLEKGAFASVDALDSALADINKNLGNEIGRELLTAQRDQAPLQNDKLVEYNGLRRGAVLTVAGVRDACGAELVDATASVSYSNEGYRESIAQFDSESSYQYAEKTVERSSTAFSTSERVSGGGIGQSGLFALSVAGSHARAKYEQSESTAGGRRSQASKFAVRKIEMTCARVRLPAMGVRLGREAASAVTRIANEADESRAQARARGFIEEFGSHLFCETRLGGCYKSVVRADALAKDSIGVLSRAASLAAGWKASGAATYVGLNFLASAATANEGEKGQAEGFSRDERDQLKSVRIDISSHAVGGLPGLSVDLWKYSLSRNQNWRVLDRHRPVAVWTLLRDATVDELTDAQKDRVGRMLERSWVRDYFLPDLLALDAALGDNDALTGADSVDGVVEAITGLMRPPRLQVCCFRETFPAGRTLRVALELPKGYKILSGGASTLQTKEGNFLISSYPAYDSMLRRWAWHAEMRDIQYASSEQHEITVVAVHDPDDEWDVRLFGRRSQGKAKVQDLQVNVEAGYLVTGGGGRIDHFGWAALTQCGFDLEPGAPHDATPGPGFRVASRSCLKDTHHVLTAIAIGLRPRNGTRLVPRHRSETGKMCAHPDVSLARHDRHEQFLGGGVRMHPDVDNFLLGSCPVVDGESGAIGWRAAAKDHKNSAHARMTVTLVGVANADVVPHEPKAAAEVRVDPSQVCLECGHVGPWTTVEMGVKLPAAFAQGQAQYLFQCAGCKTIMRMGAE